MTTSAQNANLTLRPLILIVQVCCGIALGAVWFLLLFALFVALEYAQGRAAGIFYWDIFGFKMLLVGLPVCWALPLLGGLAGIMWPIKERYSNPDVILPPGKKPVLVLVHGTFASREIDQGEAWWQFGGQLNANLETIAPGIFQFIPFHWSGKNLESERGAAGKALCTLLEELETCNRDYHVIGHSHGGSVIWNALMRASDRKGQFKHLRSWTTVGSPFFRFNARLPQLWHLLPISIFLIFAFTQGNFSLFSIWGQTNRLWPVFLSFPGGILTPTILDVLTLLVALAVLLLALDGIACLIGLLRSISHRRKIANVYERVCRRHLAIASQSDEAINGLDSIAKMQERNISLVPGLSYFSRSLIGKFFSPLTFPLVFISNLLLRIPLNAWVFSLVKNKILGNDLPHFNAQAAWNTPVGRLKAGTISSVEEETLQGSVGLAAAESLKHARGILRELSDGVPVSVALNNVNSVSLDGLIHNSYFLNSGVRDAICRQVLTSSKEWSEEELTLLPEPASPGIKYLWSRSGVSCAILFSAAVFFLCVTLQAIYYFGIVPRTAQSGVRDLIEHTNEIAGLASGREARVWYSTLCSIGRCDEAANGYHLEIDNDDNLETILVLTRWQAYCVGEECDHRKVLIGKVNQVIDSVNPILYESDRSVSYERKIHRFWSVASMLGAVKQIPRVVTNPLKPLSPVKVDLGLQPSVSKMEEMWKNISNNHALPPSLRGRLQYAAPTWRLHVSPAEMQTWDNGVTDQDRLENKLNLIEASACRFGDLYKETNSFHQDELPVERLERIVRASTLWWGGCQLHDAVAREVLDAAEKDFRQLRRTHKADIGIIIRYWLALSLVRDDASREGTSKEWMESNAGLANELQCLVGKWLVEKIQSPAWMSALPVLQMIHDQHAAMLTDQMRNKINQAMLNNIKQYPDQLSDLIRMYLAMRSPPILLKALLPLFAQKPTVPGAMSDILLEFTRYVGHIEGQQACDYGEPTIPCMQLASINTAWAMEEVAREAGMQLLYDLETPHSEGSFADMRIKRAFGSVYYEEASVHTTVDGGLAQRLGTRTTSQIYLGASRAVGSVYHIHQALRYANQIPDYDMRMIAASEVLLRCEEIKEMKGIDDLDSQAEWGNRNWEDARKAWIGANPSH
jgi:pimeloyl-ACP methyl ester carboxylesterase